MPRNGSGVFSLPAVYLATTGNTITAIQHNSPLSDIAADLNAARPVTSGGTGATTASDARTNLGLRIGVDVASKESGVPPGAVIEFYGTTAPSGWLFPYGQAVSRTAYSSLFAALGTRYGAGDGTNTFNLPDRRGRSAFGKDDMGGTAANRLTGQSGGIDGSTLGATGGAETHTLTAAEIPAHTHGAGTLATASAGAHTHGATAGGSDSGGAKPRFRATGDSGQTLTTASAGAHTHDITGSTASAGSGNAHNILPPGIVCNFLIKT